MKELQTLFRFKRNNDGTVAVSTDDLNDGIKVLHELSFISFKSERYKKALYRVGKEIKNKNISNVELNNLLHYFVFYLLRDIKTKEIVVQEYIKDKLSSIKGFKDYEVEENTRLNSLVDILLKNEFGELTIVEVKKNSINNKALKQIKKYMEKEKIKNGLLIGETLDVQLPSNIKFLEIDVFERELEKDDYQELMKIQNENVKNLILEKLFTSNEKT